MTRRFPTLGYARVISVPRGSPHHLRYPEDKSNVPAGITLDTAWSRGAEGDQSLGEEGKMLSRDPGHPWECCPWKQENPELCYKTHVQHLTPCQHSLVFLLSASCVSCRVLPCALTIPRGHRCPSIRFSGGTEESAATSNTQLQKQGRDKIYANPRETPPVKWCCRDPLAK